MNSVLEPKFNMAENENFQNIETIEVSSPHLEENIEIGDQKSENLDSINKLEKCALQTTLPTEASESEIVAPTAIIKSTLQSVSKPNTQTENRDARLSRLTTQSLRPPRNIKNVQSINSLTLKISNLSNASGNTGTHSISRSFCPLSNESQVKKLTLPATKNPSRESSKPFAYLQKPSKIPTRQTPAKTRNFSVKTNNSNVAPASKIPVNNLKRTSQTKLVRASQMELNGSDNVQNNESYEEDVWMEARSKIDDGSIDLKTIQRRINSVINTCNRIANGTHENDVILEATKSIDLNDCVLEKLKLVTQLFDMCCKEHKKQRHQNKNLIEEANGLRAQANEFAAKVNELKKIQQEAVLNQSAADAKILERDDTIFKLKTQLEDINFKLNNYKEENDKKTLTIEQHKIDLQKCQNEMEEKIASLQNKYVLALSTKKTEDLQEQIDNLEAKLAANTNECADNWHKAQQFFNEMLELKEQVKEMREDKQRSQDQVQELEKRLQEYERICSEDYMKESDCKKSREIDRLKLELYQAGQSIQHLEEQNLRNQQLLDFKDDVMNSLANNESEQKETLMECKGQVNVKSHQINDLTSQVNAKAIDCRNFFAHLRNKEQLIAQQEHEIRMLKDGNERNQLMRLKQEEKIGRYEDKINNLQQIMY